MSTAPHSCVIRAAKADIGVTILRHGTLDVKLAAPARPSHSSRATCCSWPPASSTTSRTSVTTCSCGACSTAPTVEMEKLRPRVGGSGRNSRWPTLRSPSMLIPARPHVLGIDDGPFEKYRPGARTPIVGVMMEGHDLVEAIAVTDFPVDGAGITGFLADWIRARRFASALHGVLFGGITLAGLAVLDAPALASALG